MPTHTCCGCVDILTAIKLRWESGLLAFGGRLLHADEPAAEPPNKKAGLRDEWKRPHRKASVVITGGIPPSGVEH